MQSLDLDFSNKFGDLRLCKRGSTIMRSLLSGQNSSIRQLSGDKAKQKAMYRFLENEQVTESELVECCLDRTGTLSKGRHVLVLNDTTEINLQQHSGRIKANSGIGPVGNNIDIGFFAHLGLVVDIEKYQAIGYSSINLWHRVHDKGSKESRNYRALPVEEKESHKWIKCGNDSKSVLAGAASITLVGDRESDMYELFTDAGEQGMHVLARNRIDRKTTEGKNLYQVLCATEIAGSHEIEIAADKRKQRDRRKAKLSIKFTSVCIQKPRNKSDERQGEIRVWLIEAKEDGKSDGICWRLMTTHVIESYQEAVQMVEWYQMRWFIEQVFRLLKNKGFRIEESELGTGWALRKLTIMLLQSVLRIMQMLIAYNGTSEEEDAGIVFSGEEIVCLTKLNAKCQGGTEKLKNPFRIESLRWATWIIARLGGWSGYISQRPPGPITIKNGLDKFNHVFMGWMMAKDVGTP